jgi:alkanesulfonate monooxygenase SsuD/methylene tetrahydromethanopterin reductase-like flavin-dependent oxidoreductase (luciferase family)
VARLELGIKPGQWGWSFDELTRSWAAAEEAGFDILACFDHVTASPAPEAAWNAPSLLTAMAGRTTSIALAVRVVDVSLRNPFLLAAELAVAQAASGGRLDVGLGAGSHHLGRFDHQAMSIAFPPHRDRIARLEAACRVLPALWRGERVDDDELGLVDASLGPIGIDPPRVTVGGESDGALRIAARFADRWNLSTSDPARFEEARGRLERAIADEGRTSPIVREVQLWVRDLRPDARAHLRAFEGAGAEAAILVLDDERGPDAVRRVADLTR